VGALATLAGAAVLTSWAAPVRSTLAAVLDEPAHCTVVYAADASGAFAGNNEDEVNPLTRIWFVPGEGDAYGSAFVGYDDFVIQGGVNEAGLFFDGLGVREVDVPARPGKPAYTGQQFFVEMLSTCDSVACLLDRYEELSFPGVWNGQVLFGDRHGDSVIIEPLAVIPKVGSFQVATNFFQSEIAPADRNDRRFLRATSMLDEADGYSVELVRDVLDVTHQEGSVNTVYSTVYDLGAGIIHLYYFHDFETEVTFDLAEELGQGVHGFALADLFAENQVAASVAAPTRTRLAAAVDALGPVRVPGGRLEELAGTYSAQSLTLMVRATEDGLAVRQPWTPWIDLVALSPTEFASVTIDGAGVLHEQHLTFSLDASRASVEIVEEGAGTIVATRTGAPLGQPTDWPPIAVLLIVAAAAVAAIWLARRVDQRRASHPTAAAPPVSPAELHR
jgi:hypothetical protein